MLLMLVRSVLDAVVFQVRDVWYEAGTVWCVHKDGFSLGELTLPLSRCDWSMNF